MGQTVMTDIYMILILAGAYALFSGFLFWCGRIVDETGGERT